MSKDYVKIGATIGLTGDTGDEKPEQVYVYVQPRSHRPILVQGWVGYSIPMQMRLTHNQAVELAALLAKAVEEKGRWA